MSAATCPMPPWLLAPPTAVPAPPTESRLQELPFGDLRWENFERLCVRLERTNNEIEFCRLYGVVGQDQGGIDLYSRRRSAAKYRVHQCKREENFTPHKIDTAVRRFRDGDWSSKSETFTLCTKESLRRTERSQAIERHRASLREAGIGFDVWDADELNLQLKEHPLIVDDFFGRIWARAFCDSAQLAALEGRLDGAQVVEFREKLLIFFQTDCQVVDPGLPIAHGEHRALPLRPRYVVPDVHQDQVRISTARPQPGSSVPAPTESSAVNGPENRPGEQPMGPQEAVRTYQQRRPLDDWLADAPRHILLGGPGIGKSSLLRFLVLDLLDAHPILKGVSTAHGCYLPVWISFPYWTTLRSNDSQTLSLPEAIHRWLLQCSEDRLWPLFQKALDDERLLLLVDGLDEYTNEDAAGGALSLLQVFVEQRNCRVIVTSRPVGFERLAVREVGWRIGHLAEFTPAQQRQYAINWFEHRLRSIQGGAAENDIVEKAAESAKRALADLESSGDLRELARTPLLLGLLIYLSSSNLPLPRNRFSAYGRLVEHLVATHPKARRRAALVSGPTSIFSTADETKVFAALANQLHRNHAEGLISASEAELTIQGFLEDTNGFAMHRTEAHRQAQILLDFGEVGLGLLVKRAPGALGFLHRTFQDYLTAEHLVHAPLADQKAVIQQQCSDPRWREVILGLLHLTSRPEDVAELVGLMRQQSSGTVAALTVASILCEVACGDFNCPTILARQLCEEALEEIEAGPWLPFREHLLRLVLNGLYSTKLIELIQFRLARWFPARHSRYSVPAALVS